MAYENQALQSNLVNTDTEGGGGGGGAGGGEHRKCPLSGLNLGKLRCPYQVGVRSAG